MLYITSIYYLVYNTVILHKGHEYQIKSIKSDLHHIYKPTIQQAVHINILCQQTATYILNAAVCQDRVNQPPIISTFSQRHGLYVAKPDRSQ